MFVKLVKYYVHWYTDMGIKNSSKSDTRMASALNTVEMNCLLNLSHTTLCLSKFSENCAIHVGFRTVQSEF